MCQPFLRADMYTMDQCLTGIDYKDIMPRSQTLITKKK